ncbi:MAG: TatD family hydrolase [Actinomycetes bacterium]
MATDRSYPPSPEPLPVAVADSHCHLDLGLEGPPPSVQQAIDDAAAVGVTRIVQIGCDLAGARWAVKTAQDHDEVVAAVAIHPNEAPRLAVAGALDAALAEIEALAALPCVRAVGETGLDHFRTDERGRPAQELSFRRHIALSKSLGKALVIHDRDAHDDVLRVVDDEGAPDRVVMHCFSGDAAFARRCLDRGFVLSFAGTVTFKNADPLRESLALCPSDQVLVETDAPYLAPMPYRGRANASYLIPTTLRFMAGVRGVDVGDLATSVDSTTRRVFGAW